MSILRSTIPLFALLTVSACQGDVATGLTPTSEVAMAKAATNSLAEYSVYSTMPDATPTDLRGDGRLANGSSAGGGASVYRGGTCGVDGTIFWWLDYPSGDAVFDPNASRSSCGGPARSIALGTTASAGPFINFHRVMGLADGETDANRLIMNSTGISGCDRLQYEAGSEVAVTRLTGGADAAMGVFGTGSWKAVSTGQHLVRCSKLVKGSPVPVGAAFPMRLHVDILEIAR